MKVFSLCIIYFQGRNALFLWTVYLLLLDLLGWGWRREGFELGRPRCGRSIADLLPGRQGFKVAGVNKY
jgi:hypothetical protein